MKKYCILLIFSIASIAVMAQSTAPRYGTAVNQDNTGRSLTYHVYTVTDGSGVDSLTVSPQYWQNDYKVNLVDTLTLKQPAVTRCYFGDKMRIFIYGTTGKRLKFYGTKWNTAGNATLSTGALGIIELYFNGTTWVELSRTIK